MAPRPSNNRAAAAPAAHLPPANPPQAAPSRSGEKVTVACKLPNGLVLQLFEMVDRPEQVMGGGVRMAKVAQKVGKPIVVAGVARPLGVPAALTGGYMLTPNVPADFWHEWLEQNHDNDVVVNGMIFAHEKSDHAIGQARDQKDLRSGMEPMLLNKDPRAPRPNTNRVSEIHQSDLVASGS